MHWYPTLGRTMSSLIGSTTHGKPVGMLGRAYGEHYYFLINFTVNNNAGDTTSFDGIPATCSTEDDPSHLRGDVNQTMLKSALYCIKNGQCL